jgi:hypothetical protein
MQLVGTSHVLSATSYGVGSRTNNTHHQCSTRVKEGRYVISEVPEHIVAYLWFSGNSDPVLDLDDWESASSEGKSRSENKAGGK